MKGNSEVIAYLNHLLAGELGSRDQYLTHSRKFQDMGYSKLFDAYNHEMEHETDHAVQIINRILFLEGTPNMTPAPLNIGSSVEEMFANDLEAEYQVRDNLKKGIALCEEKGDYVTRQMLVEQLKDTEEDHAYWIEKQLKQIKDMGLANYLQSQL